MPYSVTDSADGCQGWAVIKDATGEVIGCHQTKTQAEKQLTAVNIAEYGTDDRAAKMPIAVTDIDGTLVTASQQPYEPVIEALDELDVAVVVLTGRGENQRAKTEQLLEEIDVDYNALILAGSPEGKVDAMADLAKAYDVIAVFENNPETVDAYRKLGVPVTAVSQRANMEKAQEIRQKL